MRLALTQKPPPVSQYVPEEIRSTVMNFFRIPLNLFVCIILFNVALFPLSAMFGMCTLFLCLAAFLQKKLELMTMERCVFLTIP